MFTQFLNLAAVKDEPAVCPVLPEVDVQREDALAFQDGPHRARINYQYFHKLFTKSCSPNKNIHINNGRLPVIVRPATVSHHQNHDNKTTFLILGSYLFLSKILSSVRDTVRAIRVLLVSFSV